MFQSKAVRGFVWFFGSVFILLMLLPMAIRFAGEYALVELGAKKASIENVDLNLFVGTAAVEGLTIDYDNQQTLALGRLGLDLDMSALFGQKLLVESLAVSGLKLSAYQKDGQWVAGIPIPQAEEKDDAKEEPPSEPSEWTVGVQSVSLDQIELGAIYEGESHQLILDELIADNLFMWKPDDQGVFKLSGALNGAPLAFGGNLKPFAEAQVFDVDLNLQKLNLAPIKRFLPEMITALDSALSLDTNVAITLKPTGDIAIQQKGGITVALNAFAMPDINASADQVSWQGEVDVAIKKDQQPTINADGTVSLTQVKTDYEPLKLAASIAGLQWQGNAAIDVANVPDTLESTGNFNLDKLSVLDQDMSGQLVLFDNLNVAPIQVKSLDGIGFESLALTGLQVMNKSDDPSLVSLNRFSLAGFSFNDMHKLGIDKVNLDSLESTITRDKDGELVLLMDWIDSLLARLEQSTAEESDPESETAASEQTNETVVESTDAATPEFQFRVGGIEFTGDNKLALLDQSQTPEQLHPLTIETLSLGQLDSSQQQTMAPVDVKINVYDHGVINVTGEATPLKPHTEMDADVKASIKGIELPELSAYLEPVLGYRANSGQLNVTSDAKIVQGKIDSETVVKVQRVDFEPVDQEIIAKLNTHLTMPIDTALKIITDSDDNLELAIPVKGDLSNPDIRINKIIGGAISQAVQNAAVTYFKYAVQPFGAIMMVSETIGDMNLQAKFENVRFVPGTAEMVAEQQGYLKKVSDMILEKDGFSILVCVVVTDQDFQARKPPVLLPEGKKHEWDELSKQLAKARTNYIKTELIKTYGLGPDRVQTCQPQLGKGEPHAVMGI